VEALLDVEGSVLVSFAVPPGLIHSVVVVTLENSMSHTKSRMMEKASAMLMTLRCSDERNVAVDM
jgi:hypothetical protein